MAEGNDGNLLQHAAELAAVMLLLDRAATRIRLVCTHALRPFEDLRLAPGDPGTERVQSLIRRGSLLRRGLADRRAQPPIVQAFAEMEVSAERYPNSAELVRWAAQKAGKGVTGVLMERAPEKWKDLERAWGNTEVTLWRGCWRTHLPTLSVPSDPWLLTMDPMTFSTAKRRDSADLDAADLDRLAVTLAPWFACDVSVGLLAIFCYGLQPRQQEPFRREIERLRTRLGTEVHMDALQVGAWGPNLHVGALFSREQSLLRSVRSTFSAPSLEGLLKA